MKLTSLLCTVLLTLALGGPGLVSAQESTTPPQGPPAGEGRPKMKMAYLTAEEQAKLEAARNKAVEADPSLKTDMEALKQERQAMKSGGTKPTLEQRQAMMAKAKALEEKSHAAMLKADPTIAPILEKVRAHRQEMMEKMGKRKEGGKAGGGQQAPGTPVTQ